MLGPISVVIGSIGWRERPSRRSAAGLSLLALVTLACPETRAQDYTVSGCDIAAAINQANTGVGNRVLIPQGTCTLAGQLPKIVQPMAIEGQGPGRTIVDGGTTGKRVLEMDSPSGGAIKLVNLTITNGRNQLDPASSGRLAAIGGGISWNAHGGTLTIDNCTIGNNSTSLGDGGGIAAFDTGLSGTAKLVISNSTIDSNVAESGAGGGIFVGQKVDLTMSATTVANNRAGDSQTNKFGQGGGLFLFGPAGGSGSSITGGAFNSNSAGNDGGAIYTTAPIAFTSVTYSGNTVGPDGNGPDVWNNVNGTLQLSAAANAAPTVSAGSTATFTEHDPAIAIATGLTTDDTDNANLTGATVTITVGAVSSDTLALPNLAETDGTETSQLSGHITASYDSATYRLTLSGSATKEKYQAALRAITFKNDRHDLASGSRTVSFVVNDGVELSSAATATVTVTAVNDAPTMTLATPALAGITEDDTANAGQTVASIIGSTITDLDYSPSNNPAVGARGMAIFTANAGNGIWQYSIDNGTTWSDMGTVALSSALLLRSGDYLRFVPDGKNATSASFGYRAWDQNDNSAAGSKADASVTGGATPFSVIANTVSITVTAVNDAPVFTGNGTLAAVLQGAASPPGATVAAIFGPLFADVDTGASLGGIVVIDNAAKADTEGSWQYSTNGTSWSDVGVVGNTTALALSAATKVRFLPLATFSGAPGALSVRAVDNSYGGGWTATSAVVANAGANGGATPYAAQARSLTTSILPLPDLTVSKSHSGDFNQGDTGKTYTITVKNIGTGATAGTVTVTDTLPAGLTATAIGGTGWSCDPATLSCNRSDELAATASYPDITLTVSVATSAVATLTNTVTVSGGGETKTDNNSAGDPTTILATVPVPTAATGITDHGFTANWDALANAAGYYLDVAVDSAFTTFVPGFNQANVGNVTSFAVSGLAPGTGYFYRVRMYNANGASNPSDGISLTTLPGRVSAVVMDPAAPGTLYAVVDGGGVFKSTDAGSSWNPTTGQPGSNRLQSLVLVPGSPATLYAASYGSGIYVSQDSGAGWSVCANGGLTGSALNVTALASDVAGKLYAGTEGGIFTSADCTSWSAVNSGLTVDANKPPVAIAIDPVDAGKIYAALDGAGLFRSVNGGSTWTAATTQPTNLRVKGVVVKPGDGTRLFAASYGGGVFKSENSGDVWGACATQPTNLNVLSLTIDAAGRLYAGTESGMFVSTDGCGTWTAINGGLP